MSEGEETKYCIISTKENLARTRHESSFGAGDAERNTEEQFDSSILLESRRLR